MENTQDLLNALTIALVLAFATLIILDFLAGLVDLWKQLDNHESKVQHRLPYKPKTQRTVTFPYLKSVSEVVEIKIPSCTDIASNNVNTEAVKLLIQQLPQTRIRTAARRLGIADRVDGKYQKLGILRKQLKDKLESQAIEVARVLNDLGAKTSI
jgi:hypothetical protein